MGTTSSIDLHYKFDTGRLPTIDPGVVETMARDAARTRGLAVDATLNGDTRNGAG